jgi:hypothetical protein
MNALPRHQLVPGTGWDCPPEYYNYRDDRPDLYAKAQFAVLARRIPHGTAAYEALGYDRPAENALLGWLAKMLKAPECFVPNAAFSEAAWTLISAWRDELLDNLDRDEVEDMAASMDAGDEP